VYHTAEQMMSELMAQGLTQSGGGAGVDLDSLQKWVIGAVVAVIGIVVIWRMFKTYLKEGENSEGIKAEDHSKKQINNLVNAGITIGGVAVAGVVLSWVASMVISAVQG
jgi:hypothetical protein